MELNLSGGIFYKSVYIDIYVIIIITAPAYIRIILIQ